MGITGQSQLGNDRGRKLAVLLRFWQLTALHPTLPPMPPRVNRTG